MRRFVLLVCVITAGCSKKNPAQEGPSAGAIIASCDQRVLQKSDAVQVCIEYIGSGWTTAEIKARCSMDGQAYIEGACPMDGVVLSCAQLAIDKDHGATLRMYGDPVKAKRNCANVGTPM